MTRSFAEVLDEKDDEKLCGDVAVYLFPPTARRRKLKAIPRVQRVVRLVWSAVQLLDDGGFRELFRRGIPGDPAARLTVKALLVAGCPAAAEVLREAAARFPGSRPPPDADERLRILETHAAEFVGLTQRWHAHRPAVCFGLAAYIRRHREDLLTGTVPANHVKSRGSFQDLPHWARVLFAARCAKVVYPLLTVHWPNVLGPRKMILKRAIHVTAKSAIEGAPHNGVARVIALAEQTAGAAHGGRTPAEMEPRATTGISRTIASFVAKAAEKAALSANSPASESTAAVEDCFRFAQSAAVAAGAGNLVKRLKRAFNRLYGTAQSQHWTDESPISREVWTKL